MPNCVRALAIKHGRVAALGASREEVARAAPRGAEVLDFAPGIVLPGFWDCHVHLASLGEVTAGCWLYDAGSIREIVERIADFASRNPKAPAIAARAGNLEAAALAEGRLPTPADLDHAEHQRPVVISDVNKCVGNHAALTLAGFDDPSGIAWFGDKARLEGLLPRRRARFEERFLAGLDALAARGVTTAVEGYLSPDEIETVRRLDAEGRLPCRVIAQVAASTEEQSRAFAASGLEFGQELGPMSRVGPAKVFFDRFVMHRTARMAKPYEGEPANVGGYFNPPEAFAQRVRTAFDRGFPVAAHVTGDQGLAEAVEVLARELDRGGPEGSFIIHGYFAPEGVPERMAGLGLGLAAQPAFLYHWADTLERFVGRERTEHFYPLDRYLAAGVAVGASADAPIADPDPLLGLHALTARRSASGRAWGMEHALPLEQALGLYGEGAARLYAWSGLGGRLEVGGPADFVVLDREPSQAGDLRQCRVVAIFVAGNTSEGDTLKRV